MQQQNTKGNSSCPAVNFSQILVKGKEIWFELEGNASYLRSSYRSGSTVFPSSYVGDYLLE